MTIYIILGFSLYMVIAVYYAYMLGRDSVKKEEQKKIDNMCDDLFKEDFNEYI